MSFASTTKTQLAKQVAENRNQLLAELSAIVRVCGTLKIKNLGKLDVMIATENAAVARLVFTLFKKVFKRHTEVIVKKNTSLKRHHIYEVYVDDALDMLAEMGIVEKEGGIGIVDEVPEKFATNDKLKRSYIRGVFLGAGSISDPEKSYHLEFVTHSDFYANSLMDLVNSYGLTAKVIARKNNFVVYIKEGDQIVDVLNIIGAHHTLLEFENTRIMKHVRNNVNRVVNCETANLNKTITAAMRQVESIQLIKNKMGIEALPDNLREIALLRLDQPELSLTELGQLLTPPIGKSGINHRLKKIEKLAQKFMEGDEYG